MYRECLCVQIVVDNCVLRLVLQIYESGLNYINYSNPQRYRNGDQFRSYIMQAAIGNSSEVKKYKKKMLENYTL